MKRVLLFTVVVLFLNALGDTEGYSNYFSPDTGIIIANHLNTKTPYPVRPTTERFGEPSQYSSECPHGELLHFNLVARHGARQPTSGDVTSLSELHDTLKQKGQYIQNSYYHWMREWLSPYMKISAGDLDHTGEVEHYNLSKRTQGRYDNLFSEMYYPKSYPIQTTAIARAAMSGNAFGYGLFENKGNIGLHKFLPFFQYSDTPSKDLILRFFDNCPLYESSVIDNTTTFAQSKEYMEKVVYPVTLPKVIRKLNVNTQHWNISTSDLDTLFLACTWDVAIYKTTDRFCTLFDDSDILAYEVAGDLSDWWQMSYANPINYQISCPLLVDFFNSFDGVINETSYERSRLRFAHAETVIPFITLLGLYKDDFTLQWNSPYLSTRQYKSSIVSPFAANVAMGLYNCSGVYKVKLSHNEQDVPFPSCNGAMYCPYNTLKQHFASALDCPFDQLCKEKTR